MKQIHKKLSSRKGASIIIALLFFLICATVGAIILAMAQANLSHVKTERENEKDYLALSSAALIVKKRMKNAAGTWGPVSNSHSPDTEAAGVEEKHGFRTVLSDTIDPPVPPDQAKIISNKISGMMYQVYISCLDSSGVTLSVPEGGKSSSSKFTVTVPDVNEISTKPVMATITVTADYVVTDADDMQQLHETVKVALSTNSDTSGSGTGTLDHAMSISMSGTVTYNLNEIINIETKEESTTDENGNTTSTTVELNISHIPQKLLLTRKLRKYISLN